MLARTLRPRSAAQGLHADVARDAEEWPMVGFILMVDEFRVDNGATRFVPGSHAWPYSPSDAMIDLIADHKQQALACGPAGSLIIYNSSVWHGHTANESGEPRRSLQGSYVRRGVDLGGVRSMRLREETLHRISPLARYLLAL
jgi:ectoine hydroxylase-related dioxygenase (phytanoyl-CoA dioxygenase family)